MDKVSTIHWLIVAFVALVLLVKFVIFWSALALVLLLLILSPVLGIIRSMRESSIANGIASLLIPFYGLVYFFIHKRKSRWRAAPG